MRTGVCQDCGGETIGGQRGVMPKRCAACNKVYRTSYHAEWETKRPKREPRAPLSVVCKDCVLEFEWTGAGAGPLRCEDCQKVRRLAANRKRGQLRRAAEKAGKSARIGVCVDCMEQFDGPARGAVGSRCASCLELHNKNRWRRQPERGRAYQLQTKYGMTPAQYDEMLLAQDGKCAICKVHEEDIVWKLRVDHDHATGKVRALLCHSCNTTLGHMKEDPELLRAAAAYLELHAVV